MAFPAEHVHPLNIESQPNQESQHKNPIEKFRLPTNRWFVFIVFTPILILWLTTCISGFFTDSYDKETLYQFLGYINAPLTKISFELPVTLFFCIVIICLCLFVGKKSAKICVYTSSVVMILYAISCCLEVLQFLLGKSQTTIYNSFIIQFEKINDKIDIVLPVVILYVLIYTLPNFIYRITGIISFFKVDKKILCDITNYSCRSILRSLSSLLFTALITILKFLVFSLILNAIVYDWFSDRNVTKCVFGTVILIGGLSVVNVVDNYARMVISEYTIQSFWTKNKRISIVSIALKVFRNHIGTAMFASTMILSFFTTILQAFKHKPSWRIKENYIYIITKFSLVTEPNTALIFTSIYGTSFLKSYQKTFDTVLRRPTTYMAMLLALDGFFSVIYLTLIVPVAIIVIISARHVDGIPITHDTSRVFYGFFYSFLAFELLISATIKAQLINRIINLNEEDRDAEVTNLNQDK